MEQAFSFMNDTALVGPADDPHCDEMTSPEVTDPEQYKRPELILDGCRGNDDSHYHPLAWNDAYNVNGVTPNDIGRIDGRDLMEFFSDAFDSPPEMFGRYDHGGSAENGIHNSVSDYSGQQHKRLQQQQHQYQQPQEQFQR